KNLQKSRPALPARTERGSRQESGSSGGSSGTQGRRRPGDPRPLPLPGGAGTAPGAGRAAGTGRGQRSARAASPARRPGPAPLGSARLAPARRRHRRGRPAPRQIPRPPQRVPGRCQERSRAGSFPPPAVCPGKGQSSSISCGTPERAKAPRSRAAPREDSAPPSQMLRLPRACKCSRPIERTGSAGTPLRLLRRRDSPARGRFHGPERGAHGGRGALPCSDAARPAPPAAP
ncbi:unnamed protein product, partial [Coccothraustes coccothraustes]